MPQFITNRKIFLLGFMASGKSTVGPVLANKLNCPFIDIDKIIETRFNCTIAELITREGENTFRDIETSIITECVNGAFAVIATGGGAITREVNRRLMDENGITIWLDAPFEMCMQRIREDSVVRPLAPDEITARKRYEARLPLYKEAEIHILIDEQSSPEEIAEKIQSHLK